jgi:hypothetical protein
VLALAGDSETGLLERTHGLLVIDARDLRQRLGSDGDVDFADLRVAEQLVDDGQVVGDGVLDVLERLFLGGPL